MFIVGKTYNIRIDEGSGIVDYYGYKVVKSEGSVVKFNDGKREKIINTASLRFIAAEPEDS